MMTSVEILLRIESIAYELANKAVDSDRKDTTIKMLAERLYNCSRLLTRAAERLGWDTAEVQELVTALRESIKEQQHATIQENPDDNAPSYLG